MLEDMTTEDRAKLKQRLIKFGWECTAIDESFDADIYQTDCSHLYSFVVNDDLSLYIPYPFVGDSYGFEMVIVNGYSEYVKMIPHDIPRLGIDGIEVL